MNILLFGAGGFIGSNVYELLNDTHDVYIASSKVSSNAHSRVVDLKSEESVSEAVKWADPEVVISCAGVVENTEDAKYNVLFTRNILQAIKNAGTQVKKVIISGSAAEYGNVENDSVPIGEDVELNATSMYGKSKVEETALALEFGEEQQISVVIARIFNPVGLKMHSKFLISSLFKQIEDIKNGKKDTIEISRKDSVRDYVNVKDIAKAIKVLVEHPDSNGAYNIGSGISTTNQRLVELIAKCCYLSPIPRIIETVDVPEKPVASKADITRLHNEFGWWPTYSIEETIEEIVHAREQN